VRRGGAPTLGAFIPPALAPLELVLALLAAAPRVALTAQAREQVLAVARGAVAARLVVVAQLAGAGEARAVAAVREVEARALAGEVLPGGKGEEARARRLGEGTRRGLLRVAAAVVVRVQVREGRRLGRQLVALLRGGGERQGVYGRQ
jgi:hypothetical protein